MQWCEMPQRYTDPWRERGIALADVAPGDCVLDVGGSDRPTILPDQRPPDVHYVGLDPDPLLAKGDYDERVVGHIDQHDANLLGRFDVVMTWNTLEHVSDLAAAFQNIHAYLRPGGRLVALFACRWAPFAVGSRLLPHRLRLRILQYAVGADQSDHFPTRYDHCTYRHVTRMLIDWSEPVVIPCYRGAGYVRFSTSLARLYLAYEGRVVSRPNLASHYLVTARRPHPRA